MIDAARKTGLQAPAAGGLFITFEGVDGCGKSTQLQLLAQRLREAGCQVVETVEPGGTPVGSRIRSILLDPASAHISPLTELLLCFAARVENLEKVIRPALTSGAVVLSDRYTDSTVAYQGVARGLGEQMVWALHEMVCGGLEPHLTLYLEIDEQTAMERARRRNSAGLDEGVALQTRLDDEPEAFHRAVRKAFEQLAARYPERYRRIDGRGSREVVSLRVWEAVEPFVKRLVTIRPNLHV